MRYIVANWKSNIDATGVDNWLTEFDKEKTNTESLSTNMILIAPPFPYLQKISDYSKSTKKVETCAQDVSMYEPGAHTGEVNTTEILDFCKYSIIGHSERKEDLQTVTKKRDACLAAGITPIICFVEHDQLQALQTENAIFAWEDPQNISKDGVYKSKDAKQISLEINDLKVKYPKTSFLYGGSVNKDNSHALAEIKDLDGVLIGHASLNPSHFLAIINEFEKN